MTAASTTDARKRLAEATATRHFVAPDAFGDQVIWRGTGPNDPHCKPVLEGWRVKRDDPELWAAIVAMVEGAS